MIPVNERMQMFIDAIKPPAPTWYTPNSIFISDELFNVRRFRHAPYKQSESVVLVVPPFAGHDSTIADKNENAIINQLMCNCEKPIYSLDWKGATEDTKTTTINQMVVEVVSVVKRLSDIYGCKVHIIGLCMGGWVSSIVAARYQDLVSELWINGSPIDFHVGGGNIYDLVQKTPQYIYESIVNLNNGVMPGAMMLLGWKLGHPWMRFGTDFQELWNATSDIDAYNKVYTNRAWYEHVLDIPGTWYLEAVDNLFRNNSLDLYCDLSDIKCPVTVINGEEDDITLIPQCFALADQVSTPKDKINMVIIPDVGHIGGFVSSKAKKYIVPLIKNL